MRSGPEDGHNNVVLLVPMFLLPVGVLQNDYEITIVHDDYIT